MTHVSVARDITQQNSLHGRILMVTDLGKEVNSQHKQKNENMNSEQKTENRVVGGESNLVCPNLLET